MPILSGNGSWVTLQKLPVGGFIEGRFVSYEQEVPSNNPMYGPQDILTLNVNGQVTKIGAPAALKRVMRAHPEIKPGQLLKLTHQGKKRSKKGASFTAIEVELIEESESAGGGDETDIEGALAAARARRESPGGADFGGEPPF